MQYIIELESFLPNDRISTNPTILEQHSIDESYHKPSLPDAVVYSFGTHAIMLRMHSSTDSPGDS